MNVIPELEFKVGPHYYRASRISVFEQMNLAAEFRDVLIGLALLKQDRPKDMDDTSYNKAVEFIMAARGSIPPDVRERVMHRCFAAVTRKSGVGWQSIQTLDGAVQFDDIRLPESVVIMYAVFDHNKLMDFFSVGPLASDGPKTEEAGRHSRTAKIG